MRERDHIAAGGALRRLMRAGQCGFELIEKDHGLGLDAARDQRLRRRTAELRGQQIVVLDVSEQTPIFDCFVIATGTSRRQLVAISEEIDRMLRKELGERRLGLSGVEDGRWIVLDYGGVVVHLFDEESRAFYDLEGLWDDAKRLDLSLALRSTGALQESDLS